MNEIYYTKKDKHRLEEKVAEILGILGGEYQAFYLEDFIFYPASKEQFLRGKEGKYPLSWQEAQSLKKCVKSSYKGNTFERKRIEAMDQPLLIPPLLIQTDGDDGDEKIIHTDPIITATYALLNDNIYGILVYKKNSFNMARPIFMVGNDGIIYDLKKGKWRQRPEFAIKIIRQKEPEKMGPEKIFIIDDDEIRSKIENYELVYAKRYGIDFYLLPIEYNEYLLLSKHTLVDAAKKLLANEPVNIYIPEGMDPNEVRSSFIRNAHRNLENLLQSSESKKIEEKLESSRDIYIHSDYAFPEKTLSEKGVISYLIYDEI